MLIHWLSNATDVLSSTLYTNSDFNILEGKTQNPGVTQPVQQHPWKTWISGQNPPDQRDPKGHEMSHIHLLQWWYSTYWVGRPTASAFPGFYISTFQYLIWKINNTNFKISNTFHSFVILKSAMTSRNNLTAHVQLPSTQSASLDEVP